MNYMRRARNEELPVECYIPIFFFFLPFFFATSSPPRPPSCVQGILATPNINSPAVQRLIESRTGR